MKLNSENPNSKEMRLVRRTELEIRANKTTRTALIRSKALL